MIRDSIPIFESLTWIPYNAFCKMRKYSKISNEFDFSKFGISKKIFLSFPENDQGLSMQLTTFGFREPLNCRYFVEFIKEDDVVLEIGANIGYFAILGGTAKRIICIEPLTHAIPTLKKNLLNNGLMNKCEILNIAVGPDGVLLLEQNDSLNLSRIVNNKSEKTVEIQSVSLPNLNSLYNANFLRMDVEGYEYEILLNKLPKSITKMSIELHTSILGIDKTKELLSYLASEGFKIKYLIEDIPLRLYPLFHVLRRWYPINIYSYVMENCDILDSYEYIFSGRGIKYLYLYR